jgi:hypothetical protein
MLVGPLGEVQNFTRALYCGDWCQRGKGAYQETPVIPDEPDVLDANGALQGLRLYDWRRVRRVRRVG